MSAFAADINEHGLFIRTQLTAEPREMLQLVIDLPDGPMTACVTARYIGKTVSGQGIGAELFVVAERDRDRWAEYYRKQLRALLDSAVSLENIELDEITELTRR